MDRIAASQALAKALAYLACGKMEEARRWAGVLVGMLRDAGLVE